MNNNSLPLNLNAVREAPTIDVERQAAAAHRFPQLAPWGIVSSTRAISRIRNRMRARTVSGTSIKGGSISTSKAPTALYQSWLKECATHQEDWKQSGQRGAEPMRLSRLLSASCGGGAAEPDRGPSEIGRPSEAHRLSLAPKFATTSTHPVSCEICGMNVESAFWCEHQEHEARLDECGHEQPDRHLRAPVLEESVERAGGPPRPSSPTGSRGRRRAAHGQRRSKMWESTPKAQGPRTSSLPLLPGRAVSPVPSTPRNRGGPLPANKGARSKVASPLFCTT